MTSAPSILVYDSGLGGLSVMEALAKALPDAPFIYVADTAGFPYGGKSIPDLHVRANAVIEGVMRRHMLGLAVIACNTLSTLCLSELRARYMMPFVGTVPAIKVAAEQSQSHRFSLLATPRAAASDYITALIDDHAKGATVDRIGAPQLAMLCEASLLGAEVSDADIATEIAPAFFDDAQGKTDTIVLGCTHYPFLLHRMKALAPWPVSFIDPAPAIARHTASLWREEGDGSRVAYVTDEDSVARYAPVFARFGFTQTSVL